MRTSLIVTLSTGVVIGAALTGAVVSNLAAGSAMIMPQRVATAYGQVSLRAMTTPAASGQAGGDPPTTVMFTVTGSGLTMTAPLNANLGSGAPGTVISGLLGTVVVTDNRALDTEAWTATASSTPFTTGDGTGPQFILASAASYTPGTVTHTGTITVTPTTITLSGSAQTVVAGTAGAGNNSGSWNPTIAVSVPGAAVSGAYTGTLTESVS